MIKTMKPGEIHYDGTLEQITPNLPVEQVLAILQKQLDILKIMSSPAFYISNDKKDTP